MAEFVIRGAGAVFRKHRTAVGLSLSELAERLGSDKSQVAKYETNKVGVSDRKLAALAKALGLAPELLANECLLAIKPHIRSKPIGKLLGALSRPRRITARRA